MLLVSIPVLFYGCGLPFEKDNITGKWEATITEKDNQSLVELELIEEKTNIEGSLTIVGATPENDEIGKTLQIAFAEKSGKSLQFVMPLDGLINEDTVVFDLTIKGNTLEGTLHNKGDDDEKIYVKFTKINTNKNSLNAKISSNLNNIIAEIAGSYYMSWLMVRDFKTSKCSYAVNLNLEDINKFINDTESKIYNQLTLKDKIEFEKVKKITPAQSKETVENSINDLFSKKKISEEYACYYLCGSAIGTLVTNIANWNRILEYRDKENQ